MKKNYVGNMQILLLSLLTMGAHQVFSTEIIPNRVDPVPGENIWQLTKRVGITSDDILQTATLSTDFEHFITQEDIVNGGGGFTINQSGSWGVAESLVLTSPIFINAPDVTLSLHQAGYISYPNNITAIYINADRVHLDLNGKQLMRAGVNTNPTSLAAILCQGSNCTIENGHVAGDSILVVGAANAVTVKDITIKAPASFTDPALIFFANSTRHCTIEHCQIYNGTTVAIAIDGRGHKIKDCEVTNCQAGYDINGSQMYIENCIALNVVNFPFTIGVSGLNIVLKKCIATTGGIDASAGNFSINGDNVILEECKAMGAEFGYTSTGNSLTLIDCIAHRPFQSGFRLLGNGAHVKGCLAEGCGLHGFYIDGNLHNLDGNVSIQNGAYGFVLLGITAQALIISGVPQAFTWNIGFFPPAANGNPAPNDRGNRLVNNYAARNAANGYRMTGLLYDNDVVINDGLYGPYDQVIFPPIGVVNTMTGVPFTNNAPLPLTVASPNNIVGGNMEAI